MIVTEPEPERSKESHINSVSIFHFFIKVEITACIQIVRIGPQEHVPAYLNAKDVWGKQEGSESETEDRKHEACEDMVNHKRVVTKQYLVRGAAGQSGLGNRTEDRAGRGEYWRRGLGSKSNCEQRVSRQLADSLQYLQAAGTGRSGSTEVQGW